MKGQPNRVYNFGAGPATLPLPILEEVQSELLDWHHLGMSVLEVGHRTTPIMDLMQSAEAKLRALLKIPAQYHILFLGGAARTQFAMIPLYLLSPGEEAGYLVTGLWSQLALKEAQLLKKAYSLANEEASHFRTLPAQNAWSLKEDTAYVYYAPNETVHGVRFSYVPDTGAVPLIADMTSCLLSEPIDVNQYKLIFAGAQKNIANAGLTVVIVHESLVAKRPNPVVPSMFDYALQVQNHSLYATPPVFNCYLAAKMFDWVAEQGGVSALYAQNCQKSSALYDYIDASDFYTCPVAKEARSLVNVCFGIRKTELEDVFLEQASACGLSGLKGHKTLGGLRASLYNAMPLEGVEALLNFMDSFAKSNA